MRESSSSEATASARISCSVRSENRFMAGARSDGLPWLYLAVNPAPRSAGPGTLLGSRARHGRRFDDSTHIASLLAGIARVDARRAGGRARSKATSAAGAAYLYARLAFPGRRRGGGRDHAGSARARALGGGECSASGRAGLAWTVLPPRRPG